MSAFSAVALEVEFTAGSWTDVTSYLAYEAAPVVVRQGRPTELDDPGPGTLTFALWNDDGRWMPGNTGSPYSPYWRKGVRVRWKVTKAATTYTRFVGWVTAILPDFPSSSTTGSVVAVTAVDALGKLAQRKLRSNLTEISLWRARNDGCAVDAFEAVGSTSGLLAGLTNYSTDPSAGTSTGYLAASTSTFAFGTDNDASIGGVVTLPGNWGNIIESTLQPNPLQIKLHYKGPTSLVPAAATYYVFASLLTAAGATICNLALAQNGTSNGVWLRNAANTANIGIILANAPMGTWMQVVAYSNSGTPSLSDWSVILADGTTYAQAGLAVDVRTVGRVWLPGQYAPTAGGASWGGLVALGTRVPVNWEESLVGAPTGTVADRVATLASVVDQLPVSVATTGTLDADVCTGRWSGRSASDVLQEMVRTGSGLVWARSRDSAVYAVGSDELYPASPVATVDTDADCLGPPRLVDGAEARPTRIDVEWPGGVTSVVDTTAEAEGEIRSRRVTTVASSGAVAAAVGVEMFGRIATTDVRVSRVEVDLLSGQTDHTASLFSEGTTLGGLFPTQRVRLAVPASHFGTSTVDAFVQGWTETYAPDRATVALDTTPTPSGTLLRGLVVTNGSTTVTSSTPGAFDPSDVGSTITGAGIPDGTTIESVVSDTQVTISQPATQTGAGVWGVVSTKLIAVDWWGGADGAAWSSRWVAGSTATGGSTTCQGGQGQVVAGTVANVGTVRRLSGVTFTDGEIVCSVTCSTTGGFALIGYRTDGGTASVSQYFAVVKASGNPLGLGRSISSAVAYIGTWGPGESLVAGVKYRVRIRAIGSSHKLRIWQASQPEPSGWHIDVTDATYSSGSLSLGGSNYSGSGSTFLFDDYAVTKEG